MKRLCVLVGVMVWLCTMAACNMTPEEDYLLKINDEKVSMEEFQIYFYKTLEYFHQVGGDDIWNTNFDDVSAEEVAKQRTLTSITIVKATAQYAEALGLEVSEDEKQLLQENAQSLKEQYEWAYGQEAVAGLTANEDVFVTVMQDQYLYDKVFEEVTKNFVLTESDFEKYFQQKKLEHTDYNIAYILLEDEREAGEAYRRASGEEDFNMVMEEYAGKNAVVGNEVFNHYTNNLDEGESFEKIIFNLELGEVSIPIESEHGGYYIVMLYDIQIAEEAYLREALRDIYTNEQKQIIFDQESEKWIRDVTITKDETLWAQIRVS